MYVSRALMCSLAASSITSIVVYSFLRGAVRIRATRAARTGVPSRVYVQIWGRSGCTAVLQLPGLRSEALFALVMRIVCFRSPCECVRPPATMSGRGGQTSGRYIAIVKLSVKYKANTATSHSITLLEFLELYVNKPYTWQKESLDLTITPL